METIEGLDAWITREPENNADWCPNCQIGRLDDEGVCQCCGWDCTNEDIYDVICPMCGEEMPVDEVYKHNSMCEDCYDAYFKSMWSD